MNKKRRFVLFFIFIIIIMILTLNRCESYPDARNNSRHKNYGFTRIYNVKRERNDLSGVNFCEILNHFNLNENGLIFEEYDLDAIRDAGFHYIRLSVSFLSYLHKTGDEYQLDQEIFPRLDWMIENILKRDMIAILDFHYLVPDEDFMFESEQEKIENQEKFLAVWKMLAERYKDYPTELYFELANEPHEPIKPDIWNMYVAKALNLIRGSGGNNEKRMIVVATNILINTPEIFWDDVNGILQLQLPSVEEDPNIIITFHYYKPSEFTFQGQDFSVGIKKHSADWIGNMWDNTQRQKAIIQKDFDIIYQWAMENKRQIILGEFGVSKKADIVSQVNWTKQVREEAESRGMIWFYWQILDQHGRVGGVYDPWLGSWNRELLNALMPEAKWMTSDEDWSEDRVQEVQKLITELRSPDWEVRKRAAISLRMTEPEARLALSELITALKDQEWQVRKEVARALKVIGPACKLALPALIKTLYDQEWQVRMSAAQAIAVIGPAAQAAVKPLIQLLDDEEWLVRKSAVISLSTITPITPEVINAIQKRLNDPEDQVRNAASVFLRTLNDKYEK